MCGRFSLAVDADFLVSLFGLLEVPIWTPRFNIAPTQPVLAVRQSPQGRTAGKLRWGLIPHWTRDLAGTTLMINARSETAREKPAFRSRMAKGRCLIPADGFYEWKKIGTAKQPYWFSNTGQTPFAFAGLWDSWKGPDGNALESCTILTTQAQGWMMEFHERMPVIVPQEEWKLWLEPGEIPEGAWQTLTSTFPGQSMVPRQVSSRVNKADWDAPDCILEASQENPEFLSPSPKWTAKKKSAPSKGLEKGQPGTPPGYHQGELF